MCLICVEFQKERMTVGEARRAFREMVTGMTPEHAREVERMLRKAEEPEGKAPPPASQGPQKP
jgi:hypothetical protein